MLTPVFCISTSPLHSEIVIRLLPYSNILSSCIFPLCFGKNISWKWYRPAQIGLDRPGPDVRELSQISQWPACLWLHLLNGNHGTMRHQLKHITRTIRLLRHHINRKIKYTQQHRDNYCSKQKKGKKGTSDCIFVIESNIVFPSVPFTPRPRWEDNEI